MTSPAPNSILTTLLQNGPNSNDNPNASQNDTTLIIAVAAGIGALFLVVLILFVVFVLYYYKKGVDEEEDYYSNYGSRYGSRVGSRRSSIAGSRRGSIAGSKRGSKRGSKAGSKAGSRAGSRAGSMAGSRRGSIVRGSSARNSTLSTDRVFLPAAGWGGQNKAYVEDFDRELWNESKGGAGTVTQNPLAAYNKDDDYSPLDVNLDGFDQELSSAVAAVGSRPSSNERKDSTKSSHDGETPRSKSPGDMGGHPSAEKIEILDMTTWGSPPATPTYKNDHPTPFTISSQIAQQKSATGNDAGGDDQDEITTDFRRANPLRDSTTDLNRLSFKKRNQSVVDFYESANPSILGYSMQFPEEAYGTGRRMLWQKKHFNEEK